MRVLRAALWGGASLILQNGFTFAKDLEENLDTYQCMGFTAVPATLETLYRSMRWLWDGCAVSKSARDFCPWA